MSKDLFGLAGKVAVVTGGANGIGAGIAEVLAEAGATVLIADIALDKAQEQASALSAAGLKAEAVVLDLAEESSIVRACAGIIERMGVPYVLVNNAGVQDRELLLETTSGFWDREMAVNARGPFLMMREIARAMVAAGQGGRIVNIASAAVIGGITMGHAAYASSKAALSGLMRASALELVEHGITVNTILPGGVVTPGARGAKGPPPEGPGRRRPPLGMADPRDVGAAVLFFASAAGTRVTNQTLAVDGGWSIT
jgi:NAD(P)-dependent dehydrogenase (short-subunit alcohol dehydrogenase family)